MIRASLAVLFLLLAGHQAAPLSAGPVPCDVLSSLTVAVQAEVQVEPPKIEGADVVAPYKLVRLSVTGIPVGHFILWDVYPVEPVDAATQRVKSQFEWVAPPGIYRVRVRAFKPDSETPLEAWRTITIQGTGPTPPGPKPPEPGPTPTPVPPQPAAPIQGDGNRTLIVYETGAIHPPAQAAIFTSGVLRDYLDAKTVKDTHNPTGAYRIWDQHVNLNHPLVSPSWKAAMGRPRASIPWIVISNAVTGYEGPLPADVPATLTLLKKYFGE